MGPGRYASAATTATATTRTFTCKSVILMMLLGYPLTLRFQRPVLPLRHRPHVS